MQEAVTPDRFSAERVTQHYVENGVACHLAGRTSAPVELFKSRKAPPLLSPAFVLLHRHGCPKSRLFPRAKSPSIACPACRLQVRLFFLPKPPDIYSHLQKHPHSIRLFLRSTDALRSNHYQSPKVEMRHISPGPPSPPARTGRGRANTWSFSKVREEAMLLFSLYFTLSAGALGQRAPRATRASSCFRGSFCLFTSSRVVTELVRFVGAFQQAVNRICRRQGHSTPVGGCECLAAEWGVRRVGWQSPIHEVVWPRWLGELAGHATRDMRHATPALPW